MRPLLTHQIKSYPETTNSTNFVRNSMVGHGEMLRTHGLAHNMLPVTDNGHASQRSIHRGLARKLYSSIRHKKVSTGNISN